MSMAARVAKLEGIRHSDEKEEQKKRTRLETNARTSKAPLQSTVSTSELFVRSARMSSSCHFETMSGQFKLCQRKIQKERSVHKRDKETRLKSRGRRSRSGPTEVHTEHHVRKTPKATVATI